LPKICLLTTVHHPFDTRIFHREAKSLVGAGYEVVLVAPHHQDEIVDGVRIHAVPKPVGRLKRITFTAWQVYRAALLEKAAVYHFHDPELIPIGVLLKLGRKKVIYDVHEDLPRQILNKDWIPRPFRALTAGAASVMETAAARILNGIVAATPTIAARFPAPKTELVQNFPSPDELFAPQHKPYRERPPRLAYVGVMGETRGIREMIRAVDLIPDSINARLILAGTFNPPELLSELKEEPGWEKIDYMGWQPRDQVSTLLGEVRAGLVVMHPTPNNVNAYPNKLFEYASVGLPVIASNFPLWRGIIEDAGCGMVVDPLSPPLIARAMQWVLENQAEAEAMGRRGQEAVGVKYNWPAQEYKLLRFYRRLLIGDRVT